VPHSVVRHCEIGRDGRVNWGFEPQRGEPVNARKLCLRAGNPTSKTCKSKNRQKAVFANMVGTAGFEPATTTPPVWCATRLRYAPNFCACTPQCGATFYNNQGCATPRTFAPAHHNVVRLFTTTRAALRPEFLRLHTTIWCDFLQQPGLRHAP